MKPAFQVRRRVVIMFVTTQLMTTFLLLTVVSMICGYAGPEYASLIKRGLLVISVGITIGALIVHVILKPVDRVVNELHAGRAVRRTDYIRARSAASQMFSVFGIFNVSAYVILSTISIMLNSMERGGTWLEPQKTFVLVSFFAALALSNIQLQLSNTILRRARHVLQIYSIDAKLDRRFASFQAKVFLQIVSLGGLGIAVAAAFAWHLANWQLIHREPLPETFALLLMGAAVAGLIVAIFVVGIRTFAMELFNTVDDLDSGVQRMVEGGQSLNKLIPLTRFDEVGELSQFINQLTARLVGFFDTMNQDAVLARERTEQTRRILKRARNEMRELQGAASAASEDIMTGTISMDQTLTSIEASITVMDELLKGIQEQIELVRNTARSVHAMREAVDEVSSETDRAAEVAESLRETANHARDRIHKTIESVSTVDEASQDVEGIVQTISNIAERINLLAMNAAIEASHAGDSGKGFAVVANEVRKLAETTTQSATSIVDTLVTMRSSIKQTSNFSGELEKAINIIASDVDTATQMVFSMSTSAREQALNVGETDRLMSNLVKMSVGLREQTTRQKDRNQDMISTITTLQKLIHKLNDLSDVQLRNNEEIMQFIDSIGYNIDDSENVLQAMDNIEGFTTSTGPTQQRA